MALISRIKALLQSLPPEQQVALLATQAIVATRIALIAGDDQARAAPAAQVQAAADHYAEGEAPDSPYAYLAALLRFCVTWLHNELLPPAPEQFRDLLTILEGEEPSA